MDRWLSENQLVVTALTLIAIAALGFLVQEAKDIVLAVVSGMVGFLARERSNKDALQEQREKEGRTQGR